MSQAIQIDSSNKTVDPRPLPPGFASRAVHAGERAKAPSAAPASTPLYASSSFCFDDPEQLDRVFGGDEPGFVYSRYGNPTVAALETAIADLEGTEAAIAVGSGMAALHLALLHEVAAGDNIVAAIDLYGHTTNLLTNVFGTLGVRSTFVNASDLTALEQVVAETRPRAVLVETISNPLVRVADIAAISVICRTVHATLIVDNTFATPFLVTPVTHGADVIVHSTTKYLGGHGDVTGGVIATNADRAEGIIALHRLVGAVPGPFDAWLTLRGIKTLPLRMRRHSENAAEVVAWLAGHPKVSRVYYPGIDSILPSGLFRDGYRGGMTAFEIDGAGRAEVFRFLAGLQMIRPATSLGDVYSLVLYPTMSTHRDLSPEERAIAGVGDGLIRFSVGIEEPEDIIADLKQALSAV